MGGICWGPGHFIYTIIIYKAVTFTDIISYHINDDVKYIHMARFGLIKWLIIKLDEAICNKIISETLLAPKSQ